MKKYADKYPKCPKCKKTYKILPIAFTHEAEIVNRSLRVFESDGPDKFIESLAPWLRSKMIHQMEAPVNYSLELNFCDKCSSDARLLLYEVENDTAHPFKLALHSVFHSHRTPQAGDKRIVLSLIPNEAAVQALYEFTRSKKEIQKTDAVRLPGMPYEKPKSLYSYLGFFLALAPTALLIGGEVYLHKQHLIYEPFNGSGVAWIAVFCGLPIAVLYILACYQRLFSSPTRGRDMAFLIFINILVMPVAVAFLFIYLNGRYDKGSPLVHHVRVVGKEITKYDHFAHTETWRKNKKYELISITKDEYGTLVPNESYVDVYTSPGRFGYEWLVRYEISK